MRRVTRCAGSGDVDFALAGKRALVSFTLFAVLTKCGGSLALCGAPAEARSFARAI